MSKVILVAPLAGWSTPLDEAPDAVFAGRMLGDGVALDPTGATLCAPCDGELIAVPVSKHSMTLRTRDGAEILLHVGIDTVGLAGEGFELHARQGQHVRAGDRLLSFDLDLLARRAKSLLTPVIVMDGGGFTVSRRNLNREVNVGDFLMELMPVASVAGTADGVDPAGEGAAKAVSRRLLIRLEHGIHARPAALLVAALKGFTAEVRIVARGREASARSTVTLMTLGVRKGDEIEIRAAGPDADAAVDALEGALLRAAAQGGDPAPPGSRAPLERRAPVELRNPPAQRNSVSDLRVPRPKDVNTLPGVVASRGLAIGYALQFSRPQVTAPEAGAGVSHENSELDRARILVKSRLERAAASGSTAARDIIGAHLALLDDPELVGGARTAIASGKSAGYAWGQVIRSSVSALRALEDARMAERVDDLLDLEAQILGELSGDSGASPRELPEKTILIANELLPSQLVALDARRLAGICMAAGGPTSHVAILAAAMGVPALVAMGPAALAVPAGTPVVLDAEEGVLRIDPDRGQMEAASNELAKRLQRRAAEQVAAQRECRTADGVRIEVFANIGSVVRYPYRSGDLKARGKAEVIVRDVPHSVQRGHIMRDIVFSRAMWRVSYRGGP